MIKAQPQEPHRAARFIVRSRMRRLFAALFVIVAAAAGVCFGAYRQFEHFSHAPLSLGAPERIVQIPPGTSARGVADILRGEGIVENRWMMLYILKNSGLAEKIQPGAAVIIRGMTPADLPALFARVGKYARLTVQILPGMNIYEIAARMQESRIADEKRFAEIANDGAFAAHLGIPAASLEGYLAAGAYTFEPGAQTRDVIGQMHRRWRDQWQKIVESRRGAYENAQKLLLNDHAIVTLASIVEKEAMIDEERPVIARVFLNRLRKKMMLQSDPTCVYPPKMPDEKPTPGRCKDPANRYSTYIVAGLPPGPIDTPSQASIRAVLSPYDGPDAQSLLYFVARADGSRRHYFSKTYAEHRQAVDFFLKKKKISPPKATPQPLQ